MSRQNSAWTCRLRTNHGFSPPPPKEKQQTLSSKCWCCAQKEIIKSIVLWNSHPGEHPSCYKGNIPIQFLWRLARSCSHPFPLHITKKLYAVPRTALRKEQHLHHKARSRSHWVNGFLMFRHSDFKGKKAKHFPPLLDSGYVNTGKQRCLVNAKMPGFAIKSLPTLRIKKGVSCT